MTTERPPGPPEEPSERVKQDIEEILRKMGDEDEREPEPLRVVVPRKPRVVKPRGRPGLQPAMLMAIGAVLLVLAVVIPPLRLALAVGGLLLLGTGYWMSWQSGRSGQPGASARRPSRDNDDVSYWRGQRIDYGAAEGKRDNIVEFREKWTSKVRRWLRRR